MIDTSRRNFLRGKIAAQATYIRPPWSLAELPFMDACTRCGECITHCQEHILSPDRDHGYPRVDFTQGKCTFCRQCVVACPTSALHGTQTHPWAIKAKISNHCLAKQQVVCQTCGEQCEAEAIHFMAKAGGVPQPSVQTASCTGCGACVDPCPTQSIEVCL